MYEITISRESFPKESFLIKLIMKNLVLIITLLLFNRASAQAIFGTAEYQVVIGKDSLFQSHDALKTIYSDAMEVSKDFVFKLQFNKNESLFTIDKKISEPIHDFALSMVDFINPIYTNVKTGEKIYTSQDNEFLITDSIHSDWKLSSETKMIDNYLCYKATSEHKITNGRGVFKFPVTVWFCPALPYSFGPIGNGKLPGLIVEYHRRNFVYGLKKLTISDQIIEIKKPSKGHRISSQDYNTKLIEAYKRSKEDFERSKN